MKILSNLTEICADLLENAPIAEECRSYLNSRINKEMQKKFEFGYYPSPENISLLTSLISEKELKEAKLLYEYTMQDSVSTRTIYTSYFEHHPLIFPFKDLYGNIVGLVGRTLLNDTDREANNIQKYKNTKFEKSHHVFGLYEAKNEILEKNYVLVVEGQFDVIKAFERGTKNIVAVGSSNLSDYQLSLICRYTNNIFILFDNDEAGDKGRSIAFKKFNHLTNIVQAHLPVGYKDIDEYFKENTKESLKFIIKNIKYFT